MEFNKYAFLEELKKSFLYDGIAFYSGRNTEFMDSMGDEFKEKWFYEYGASKFVLIPKNKEWNFVIKIPYTGNSWDEDGTDYYDYENADCDERCWDYCAGEENRYQIAIDEGLEKCFAKTTYIGDVRGYPIYKQERCKPFSHVTNSHSNEEKQKTSKICGYCDINLNWLTDFRLYYGEDLLIHFTHFITIMNWDDDLRTDNIGYINDRPVLIDYSGFLED